jgi:hypothetical protein
MSEYVVVFERAEDGGWGPTCRIFPAWSWILPRGSGVPDPEAVDAYAQEMVELGQPLPEPVAATGTIQAA